MFDSKPKKHAWTGLFSERYWNWKRGRQGAAYVKARRLIPADATPDEIMEMWKTAHGTLPILNREVATPSRSSIGQQNGPRSWEMTKWRIKLAVRLQILSWLRLIGF